ncbi:acyltransferase family protein [Diaphorobacter caeni]|uniref:acyltransferase family protein n=1 Tax=Diaphorobacter caeni TaxID=2784387 RepID=UPI00188FE6DD|nr:acyltransferase [Diaphorobacter caeni]MBF5007157.1 acyltransferase [Diaphorobacter caeni]
MSSSADHRNNFNLLRLLAAVAVLFSHGAYLYHLQMPIPFMGHSLGSAAVCVFFVISGYLIAQSWERSAGWSDFVIRRVARIYPGLICATVFSIAVIGALMTTWPQAAYWSSPVTWANFVNNAAGLATVQVLPGVFENNPFARAVNGSLWTIRYELAMYLLLALVSLTLIRWWRWAYLAMALSLAAIWLLATAFDWPDAPAAAPQWFKELWSLRQITSLGVYFFVGSAWAKAGWGVRWWHGLVGVAALTAARCSSEFMWVQMGVWVGLSCLTMYLAFAGAAWIRGQPRADLSYGTYIYAFPIQQAVTEVSLAHGWSLAVCVGLSLVLTLGLATLSWFLVEKPALEWTRRWLSRRKPALPPLAAR